MEIKDIKELIRIVDKSSITELEIEEKESKVRIAKNTEVQYVQQAVANPVQTSVQAVTSPVLEQSTEVKKDNTAENSEVFDSSKYIEVKSPMVGTFYSAPSPDADPFVKQGDTISQGQTLCIIEAMKLMNEIQAEGSGKIAKVLVSNSEPVEYNQALFWIEK